jgi:hypothetical protein
VVLKVGAMNICTGNKIYTWGCKYVLKKTNREIERRQKVSAADRG